MHPFKTQNVTAYSAALATSKIKNYEKNIDTINWNFDYIL